MFKLIVGLGNPGVEYLQTRHNVGFWWVDDLADQYKVTFRPEHKYKGEVVLVEPQRLYLLKPMTYMNKSGESVLALAHFYKILPSEILVVHDELDLPVGTIRFKVGGGHGGHNGLKSIISALGSQAFYRLRVGIGHPGHASEVSHFVLRKAPAAEQLLIEEGLQRALHVMPQVLSGQIDKAMQQLHTHR